jgi:hypothetical protein
MNVTIRDKKKTIQTSVGRVPTYLHQHRKILQTEEAYSNLDPNTV